MDYNFVPGCKVAIVDTGEINDRTWHQGVIPAGFIMTHEGPWKNSVSLVTVAHPEWGPIPAFIRVLRLHYDPGDGLRLDVQRVPYGGWSDDLRAFVDEHGEDHVFTVATKSDSAVQVTDGPGGWWFRTASTIPVVGSTTPGPCRCPLPVLMSIGCRCGGL